MKVFANRARLAGFPPTLNELAFIRKTPGNHGTLLMRKYDKFVCRVTELQFQISLAEKRGSLIIPSFLASQDALELMLFTY